MPQVWDKGRPPVWVFRARPYDPQFDIERNVWVASTYIETDEPFEGWLSFDGVNDVVRIPDDPQLDLVPGFSIGVRFRTTVLQNASLVTKGLTSTGSAASGGWFLGLLSAGFIRGAVADAGRSNADSAQSYADGEWHTLLYTFNAAGNVHQLWYDTFQVASVGTAVNVLANGIDAGIGASIQLLGSPVDDFEGDVERVVILDSVDSLTGHALLLSRDLTKSVADDGPVANLVAAYPINEGHSTFVQDVSGDGHHGTLQESGAGGLTDKWSIIAPPPMTIPGLLESPFSVSGSLLRGGSRLSTHALPSFGAVGFNNPDGELDHFAKYHWDGRLTEHRQGLEGDLVSAYDVIWVRQADQPEDVSKDDLSIGIRGVEDVFEIDLQQDRFRPGFEPYVIGNGSNRIIDFTNVLNRSTQGFVIGCAFRTTNQATQFLYGRKTSIGGAAAGYSLGLGSAGAVRFDLSDGVGSVSASFNPPDGYADGQRHTLLGAYSNSTQQAFLYYDGVLVATQSTAALGSVSSPVPNLTALASGGTASQHFNGELERILQRASAGTVDALDALDERYAEDVDASSFDHYVPMTENTGTTVEDTSPNGFDGTISGGISPFVEHWSGTRNGTRDLEGKPKPLTQGRASLNPSVWVDNEKLIIQAMSRNFQSANIFSLREGFVPIPLAVPNANDIFLTEPPDGTFRFQTRTNQNNSGNEGVFIRLGSRPTGTITWSGDHTDINLTPAQFYPGSIFALLSARVAGAVEPIGFAELQAAAPYISGHYWDEQIKGREAFDEVLEGVAAHWTVDPRQPFDENDSLRPTVFQLRDLTGETPVATYLLDPTDLPSDFAEEGFKQIGVSPVFRKVVMRYQRYRGFLTSLSEPQELPQHSIGFVDFKLVTELLIEWRATQAPETQEEIDAVLERFRDAEDLEVDSGMWGRRDSVTEAQRIFDLYNRLNRTYRVELTGGLFTHWIGDVIAITATRILSDPESGPVTRLFLVVGVDDDANNSGTQLELWGGWPTS